MERRRIASGTEWEARVGYSRAVRAGSQIHVSGTTATDKDGNVVGEGDPYEQTKQALANVEDAPAEADASLEDVVRTRMFVTDIDDWESVGEAHSDLTVPIAKRAGEIEGAAQRSDQNDVGVGLADAIIAATAIEFDEPVVTDDETDFIRRIQGQAGVTELDVDLYASE